ncbi:hypothetical protein [Brucella pseudogrignonensis]|uniref:SMODS-associating 2TM beta-strand rich effector domain-containing protein n=1 Tax=Brucella pseudogrignonensis TaxID=419475 RepID=A0ABU1ME46_9HYPH|nr:hypothetical protein [Brucella pseudogrignonensis]MDR6434323.1 hypothetical protein [Brucella pseudogrignonensis]
MLKEHEYALLGGMNRSNVGRHLARLAAFISAGIVFLLLSAVDIAARYGLPVNLPPTVLSLVGASVIFAAIYWFFDRFLWRWPMLGRILKVPDISGKWNCKGRTFNRADGTFRNDWEGTITILQSWDKLFVRLKGPQSGSHSIAAAITCDPIEGYHLLYNYVNEPKAGEADLKSHRGFAQITFAGDRQSAEGEYFNGFSRDTFGALQLTRAENGS